MAKPTVAIRVDGQLYDELVQIAESRDVTITQALGIYIHRQRGAQDGSKETASNDSNPVQSRAKRKVRKARKPDSGAPTWLWGIEGLIEGS